jgi:glycosyltransferase involved in cell wall biosynthesis
MTVKNGEKTIEDSIDSVLNQSVKPALICIIDDGSIDSTPRILEKLQKENEPVLHIMSFPDRGYDIRRIVHNWNEACDYVKSRNVNFGYLVIVADDIILPKEYVEKLCLEMKKDSKLVIVSGSRGLESSDDVSFPEGAGRIIDMNFFSSIGLRHPPYYGYEPWILFKALQLGYKIKKFDSIKYDHKRTFGIKHNFVEYGVAMRCLGYHPMFVMARVLKNIFSNKSGISKRASVQMIFDYLNKKKWADDPYFKYFEPDLRHFVRTFQKKRLYSKLKINN